MDTAIMPAARVAGSYRLLGRSPPVYAVENSRRLLAAIARIVEGRVILPHDRRP
jgi:hypothetical protein